MKSAIGSSAGLIAFSALMTIAQAEDALYSKRMVKRGIDADGNYNICKSACMTPLLLPLT
jgi:5'-nucleotidase